MVSSGGVCPLKAKKAKKGQFLPPALATFKAKMRSKMFLIMSPFVHTLMLNKAEKLLNAKIGAGPSGLPRAVGRRGLRAEDISGETQKLTKHNPL